MAAAHDRREPREAAGEILEKVPLAARVHAQTRVLVPEADHVVAAERLSRVQQPVDVHPSAAVVVDLLAVHIGKMVQEGFPVPSQVGAVVQAEVGFGAGGFPNARKGLRPAAENGLEPNLHGLGGAAAQPHRRAVAFQRLEAVDVRQFQGAAPRVGFPRDVEGQVEPASVVADEGHHPAAGGVEVEERLAAAAAEGRGGRAEAAVLQPEQAAVGQKREGQSGEPRVPARGVLELEDQLDRIVGVRQKRQRGGHAAVMRKLDAQQPVTAVVALVCRCDPKRRRVVSDAVERHPEKLRRQSAAALRVRAQKDAGEPQRCRCDGYLQLVCANAVFIHFQPS